MSEENKAGNGAADISELDISSADATMEVRGLNGEVLRFDDERPFTITLISQDSQEFVTLARKQQDRRTQQAMRTRQPASATTQEADAIELLVAVTKSWDILLQGEKPASTPENYRSAYKKYPRLRQQVDEYLGNPANFSKG